MHFITSKCYMHLPITSRIRSIVDKSLVHCHRGCEFESRRRTFLMDFIVLSIYLLRGFIHNNHFKTIWVDKYRFNDSKQFIPF